MQTTDMSMVSGTLFDIKHYALHDGPGIRCTVFLKGCPLECWWCHNPESRNPRPQEMQRGTLPHQRCEQVGYEITAGEAMRRVLRDLPFIEQSGGGVTFSGGEPLVQPEFLTAMLTLARKHELHTAVDTTGYADWDAIRPLLGLVDLWLYDVKHLGDTAHRQYCGVSNGPILDNLRRLDAAGAELWLRVPVIPGVNDDEANLTALGLLAGSLTLRPKLSLLPYRKIATNKYRGLGMEYKMDGTPAPSQERMESLRAMFEREGFEVDIGG